MASINRPAHCLKRESSLAMPRHIIFFDTETDQIDLDDGSIEQRFKLGWACYYRKAYCRNPERVEWIEFTDLDSFWTFVLSHCQKKRKLWVIAHNLNFDFTIVKGWSHLMPAGFKLKFFHNSGVCTIISVRSKRGSMVFVDFMNWFPESLEVIGDRIGLSKLKIDFAACTISELSTYCKRDVEILLAAFKHFVGFLEAGKIARLCYTRASTSMSAFLWGCYDHKIWIHNNSDAIDLERDSYRGGRVECFYLGQLNTENYYILDVNSLYPTVMYNCNFPVKYRQIKHDIPIDYLKERLRTEFGIGRVLIDTDEPAYAVRLERTIFPIGQFWVTLCTPELIYALDHNHIVEIDRCVFYESEKCFRKFIGKFYPLRLGFKKKGAESYEVLVKYLMNSFYGKFGQKGEVWEKIGQAPNEVDRVEVLFSAGGGPIRQLRYLMGEVWELTAWEETFNSFPGIASHVAAYARMYLYKLMKTAGKGNYFYCDTDSLIVNEAGFKNLKHLVHDTNLGCLKLVETTKSITIRGLKDYSTDTKTVLKGVRKNAVKIADGVYDQERWPSLKGLLRSKETDRYTITTERKVLQREYTKGRVRADGSVEPFDLYDSVRPFARLF